MKDFMILKFLDHFIFLFRIMKVDYQQLRSIIQIKLTLDSRRAPTIMASSNNKSSPDKNFFLMSLLMYAVIGVFLISLLFVFDNLLFQMSSLFGIVLFIVTLSLISDFSNVLLDLRDKSIIATKPVSSRTIAMAKTIHILIYMSYVTLALTIPTLLIGLFKYGIVFFLLYLLSLIFINLLIIMLTSLVYLFILRFFSGDKLKDIINFVQIGLSLTVIVSYQFLGQLFQLSELDYIFKPAWWQYFIIPMWFAAPFELLINHDYSTHFIVLSALAIIVPFLAIIIYQKLIPVFEQYLEKLNSSSTKKFKRKKRIRSVFIHLLCRNKEERVMYHFTNQMFKTEREFKLKVYPSLGFALIFPYIFIFNFYFRTSNFENLASSSIFFSLYFSAMIIPTLMMNMQYSNNYKAAWIFETLPIESRGNIIKGTLKAAFIKLVLPIFLLNSVVFTYLLGPRIILDLSIILLSLMVFMVIAYQLIGFRIPFAKSYDLQDTSTAIAFLLMFVILGFAGVHFIFTRFDYGNYIYLFILLITTIWAWTFSFNMSWLKPNNS